MSTWCSKCWCLVLSLAIVSALGCQRRNVRVSAGTPPEESVELPLGAQGAQPHHRANSHADVRPNAVDSSLAEPRPDTGANVGTDAANEIVFVTEGSSFSPVVVLRRDAKVRWRWADGSESDSPQPVKSYGSRLQRRNRLHVDPWSAVRRINIGFDAMDGGDPSYERVADQEVSAVHGLAVVSAYLEQWFSSYNRITSLDFSHFRELRTIECFGSRSLTTVTLKDTPKLERACFEADGLTKLDLSESPNLVDLRGALNPLTDIDFGGTGSKLWHICIRDNPQLTQRTIFSQGKRFPQLAELFVFNAHQQGTLAIQSTHPDKRVELYAMNNAYDTADFRGALRRPDGWALVNVSGNALERLFIDGCAQIKELRAENNRLNSAAIDAVLAEVDSWNTEAGSIDLRRNAPPTATGRRHQRSLELRRWKVELDAK